MYNVIELIAEYGAVTSGYRGHMRIVVATYPSIVAAMHDAATRTGNAAKVYEPGECIYNVEGVKPDLHVKCAGDHWADVILADAENGCTETPCHARCASA